MRYLWVKKLPSAAQLQSQSRSGYGGDYTFDLEKKVWLPGSTTPVRAVDFKRVAEMRGKKTKRIYLAVK